MSPTNTAQHCMTACWRQLQQTMWYRINENCTEIISGDKNWRNLHKIASKKKSTPESATEWTPNCLNKYAKIVTTEDDLVGFMALWKEKQNKMARFMTQKIGAEPTGNRDQTVVGGEYLQFKKTATNRSSRETGQGNSHQLSPTLT